MNDILLSGEVSMVRPKPIVFEPYLEIHSFGDYISVCWNTDKDGNRDGDSPRIAFLDSRSQWGLSLTQISITRRT